MALEKPAEPAQEDQDSESAAEPALEDSTEAKEEPAKPAMKTPEEVTAEAAELNKKLGKWAYAIPSYTAQNFTKRMADMIKSPEEKAAELEAESADAIGEDDPDGLMELQEVLGKNTDFQTLLAQRQSARE